MALLELRDTSVSYGSIKALHGISFSVDEGEIVTLIGANGAGKTTTMKTIMGLLSPESGSVIYNGTDITQWSTKKRVQNGIVLSPEGRQIFPSFSVLTNLEMGGFLRKEEENQKTIETVYELFPILEKRKTQLAGTLSGGEQQMLAVGRALMSKPKLLLLDEPSMGLAPLLVKQILDLIERIKAMGVTILLVEQNARAALRISDRAYVLQTGNVVLSGSASELLNSDSVKKAYLSM